MLIKPNNDDLKRKIDRSIRLLRSIDADVIELAYSGGKDSDVILQLAKLANIPFRAIYKNTTIDPPGTIMHCKSKGVEIVNPKYTFYKLIEQHGFPTMRARFCCEYLKEYKILDNCIQGIRRGESVKRKNRYKEPIICRTYGSKSNHVNVILPILDWTDKDVADFVMQQNITCHPLYYSSTGHFDVTRRLGCLCCPLKSDKGLAEFKENPKMVKTWIKAGQIWWNRPRIKTLGSHSKFSNIYELFAHNLFFTSYDNFSIARSGFFGKIDFKERLESYFNIELP